MDFVARLALHLHDLVREGRERRAREAQHAGGRDEHIERAYRVAEGALPIEAREHGDQLRQAEHHLQEHREVARDHHEEHVPFTRKPDVVETHAQVVAERDQRPIPRRPDE